MNFTTGYILTKAGEALHAKVEAGTTLKLTKMQLGSGTVTTVDDYYERSALVEPQNAMSIAEIQQVTAEKNMCVATAVLTNAAVDTSYMASELGLFAQNTDGTEILYAVSYDDHPSYIASKNDGTDITMKFSMYIVATSEITITLTLPKTAEEIATIAAGYAAQAAESELKAKQLEATANDYLQTTQQAMILADEYANLSKAWAEGSASPDGVVDTNSPTGYTQSAKIWAALSKEYAGFNKFKLPIGYYNNVDEMRASETAIVGRPCVTLGYYQPNDGGGGVYIIRSKTDSDTDDGGSIIVLDNGNVAELLVDGAVNVRQFGAKGEGSTDDTTAIQNAINYSISKGVGGIEGSNCIAVVIPNGKYRTTATINIDKNLSNWELHAETSVINYEGSDYAFYINRLRYSSLHFGVIDATNAGGCIHFKSIYDGSNNVDWFQYVNIYFDVLQAKTDCILSETENNGWGNEVRLFGGRFRAGQYGLRIENNGSTIIDKWACYNIGIEGVTCGAGLHNNGTGQIWEMLFINCRTEEATSVLETTGTCAWCQWIDPYPIDYSKIKLSTNTRTFKFITGVDYIDIPRSSTIDADTFFNIGSYRIDDWTTANNSTNFPEKTPGILTVQLPDRSNKYYVTQKFSVNNATGSNTPLVYQRTWNQDMQKWTDWERIDGWSMRFGRKVIDVDSTNLVANQKMSFIAVDNGVVHVNCDSRLVALFDNTISVGMANDPGNSDFRMYRYSIPIRKGHQVYIETISITEATIKFVYNG